MDEPLERLWSLFETEICDLSTSQFLQRPDLVSVISPMTNRHAGAEAAKLAAYFTVNSGASRSALIARQPKVVISNCHLVSFAGSELWTEDVAHALKALGLPILVHSPKLGAVSDRMRNSGLMVTDDPEVVAQFAPDLLHVNHYAAAQPVLRALRNKPAIVNMIHGLLPRPGLPGREGVNAYCAVALHALAKTHLLTGQPWESITLVPSFFDPTKFKQVGDVARGNRALLFSSKTSPPQRERLAAFLSKHGYSLDHVGYGGVPSAAPGELLPNYDIVFAVARSAVEALACGCRVIVWDDGLMGPVVTAPDFWLFTVANFSVAGDVLPRCAIEAPDAEEWVAKQLAPIDSALQAAQLARAHLSIDRVLPRLLDAYVSALEKEAPT